MGSIPTTRSNFGYRMQREPVIRFNVNDPDHRRDAYYLLTQRTLSKCRNRYNLEGNYGDVVSMIADQLNRYYLDKEFGG